MDYRNAFKIALPYKATVLEHLDKPFNWHSARFEKRFNGIDADDTLASLSPNALKNMLFKIEEYLKPEGLLYMTLKYGKGEGCYNLNTIAMAVSKPLVLEFFQTGISDDGVFHVILKKGEKKSKL